VTDQTPTEDAAGSADRDPADRLEGWKRIAAYLGRDVRTLRRWEKNQGLPIHRLMHDRQGTVYAYRTEIEAWRQQRGQRPASKPRPQDLPQGELPGKRRPLVMTAAVVIALLAAVLIGRSLSQRTVVGYGEKDWVLITHFDNRTGEPELDGTLEYAMERELSNSRYVRVLPRFRVNDVLQLMQLPPDTRIDAGVGREISLRDGAVRFIVDGRIEKLGDAYTLYADLIVPEDGVIASSFVTEVDEPAGVLPGVRRLAGDLRRALGEEVASIRRSEQELASVTTPSLEALRLYSQANAMMMGVDRMRAVPVLQEAVRIDPGFASAHLLLWYSLRDRNQIEQAMVHLQRAVELAEDTAERERLFILASYYQFYLEDIPKAIETYELLAGLHPDHFWAISNLASLNEMLGYHERAYSYQLRRADLRPGQGWQALEAARAAAIYGTDEDLAEYTAKARVIAGRQLWMAPHIDMLAFQRQWLLGDYQPLIAALDSLTAEEGWDTHDATGQIGYAVRSMYLSLGRLARFNALSPTGVDGGSIPPFVDHDRGDPEPLKSYLDLAPTTFWTATLLAATGRIGEAKKMIEDPEAEQNTPRPFVVRDWKNLAAGELALAEGRFEEAVSLLGESVPNIRYRSKMHYLHGARSLARAQAALGRLDEAVDTLEQARRERQWSVFEYAATYFWYRSQLYLMELYRSSGKPAGADAIAGEIRNLLAVADADFPVLDQLDGRSADSGR
jgi:tetratricopeptide (TPR) repeat protein